MNASALLLMLFDANLSHAWESLESVLKGVTEDEARWQAPCYAHEEPQPNCPPVGTILWQLDHLSGCNRHYVQVLRQRPAKEVAESATVPPPGTFAAAMEELRASHTALRAELARVQEHEFLDACGHGSRNVADFISGCLRHEVWHAGQIGLVRRLYRTRTN